MRGGARAGQNRALGVKSYRWLYAVLCGCWKLNPGLLEEQQAFITIEPSL